MNITPYINAPTRAVVVLEALAAKRGSSFRTNRKSSDAEEALFELRQWLFQVGERKEAVAELTAERDALKALNAELVEALEELVARCDGEEGVRADGSNIQTMKASAVLAKVAK